MSVKYINSGVDLNAISELHRKNSPQNRCSGVLDWQYNSHKTNGATIFAAVDENGDVVGSQGAIYYKLLVSGKEVKQRNTQVWIPARWVKQKEGWTMQKGKWVSRKEIEARREAAKKKQACGHKKGYKIGYRKSSYADEYDFRKK